ncbi:MULTISPECIES: NUDIX hydrolase [Bacillaceae]|uniref:CoA pyrophosphatase n=1 Tax=Evansella alkalicola TaxID=745819 RepID=A0ABS6JVE8_9BACI|nr:MULTISPECIES: CoA pyrophosphatase [Bacillaceae]MBU9722558.1 CoA pyrophosphatase [Bacillus alkalicola]
MDISDITSHFHSRKAKLLDYDTYYHFSLFVPLIEKGGEMHILFEVRAQNIRQPGEICFPGGKVDDTDPSHEYAAVRELSEELGVDPSKAKIISALDYMVTPFKLILFPFLGVIDSDADIKKNEQEVKEIFTIPVSELMKMTPKEHKIYLNVQPEEEFPYHLIPNGENYNWRTGTVIEQFYDYNGKIIWGLTARILTHVLDELKSLEK